MRELLELWKVKLHPNASKKNPATPSQRNHQNFLQSKSTIKKISKLRHWNWIGHRKKLLFNSFHFNEQQKKTKKKSKKVSSVRYDVVFWLIKFLNMSDIIIIFKFLILCIPLSWKTQRNMKKDKKLMFFFVPLHDPLLPDSRIFIHSRNLPLFGIFLFVFWNIESNMNCERIFLLKY